MGCSRGCQRKRHHSPLTSIMPAIYYIAISTYWPTDYSVSSLAYRSYALMAGGGSSEDGDGDDSSSSVGSSDRDSYSYS